MPGMKRRSSFVAGTFVFLVVAIAAAAISNALAGPERRLGWIGHYEAGASPGAPVPSPPAPHLEAGAPSDTGKVFPPHPDKAWVEISADDAVALYARRNVLFLDARRSSVYRDGHIPGARSISVWEADADEKVKALYAEGRDQSAPIVVYCSGGDCEDSHMLGEKLYFVGFDNVLVYKDGFPDWEKRGLPVHKGDQP
jgi:rhodanese-related sulfurtransferase